MSRTEKPPVSTEGTPRQPARMQHAGQDALVEVPNFAVASAAIKRLLLGEGRSRLRRPSLYWIRLLLCERPLSSVPEPAGTHIR